ncbi:MAG: toll/interleukin-1 receptor domain-containing protein [Chloroflexi bacterium]|nr:toll/interleukin-1 receptor domain-containing protein [Chloroflexota bacterium]
MTTQKASYAVNLFYSYSHKDSRYREDMEKSLALLKRNGILSQWSDRSIMPGRSISDEIRLNMEKAQIFVFLLSPDFIASEECMKEWREAKDMASENRSIFRIPIIVRNCSWKDLLKGDDLKALPEDGEPVFNFLNQDEAWEQVYEGVKLVTSELRNTFSVKGSFLDEMERTDFISEQHIRLQDIYIFPRLICQ